MPFKFGFSTRRVDQPEDRDLHLHAVRQTQAEGEEPRELEWRRRIRKRKPPWGEVKQDRVLRFLLKVVLISGGALVGMLLVLWILSR